MGLAGSSQTPPPPPPPPSRAARRSDAGRSNPTRTNVGSASTLSSPRRQEEQSKPISKPKLPHFPEAAVRSLIKDGILSSNNQIIDDS